MELWPLASLLPVSIDAFLFYLGVPTPSIALTLLFCMQRLYPMLLWLFSWPTSGHLQRLSPKLPLLPCFILAYSTMRSWFFDRRSSQPRFCSAPSCLLPWREWTYYTHLVRLTMQRVTHCHPGPVHQPPLEQRYPTRSIHCRHQTSTLSSPSLCSPAHPSVEIAALLPISIRNLTQIRQSHLIPLRKCVETKQRNYTKN